MRSLSSATWTSGEPVSDVVGAITADNFGLAFVGQHECALHARPRCPPGSGPDRRCPAAAVRSSAKDDVSRGRRPDAKRRRANAPARPAAPSGVQNPHRPPGRGACRRDPSSRQVLRTERVAVKRAPQAERRDRHGRQVGQRLCRRQQVRRDRRAQPFGLRQRHRLRDVKATGPRAPQRRQMRAAAQRPAPGRGPGRGRRSPPWP